MFTVPDFSKQDYAKIPPYSFSLPEYEGGQSIFKNDPIFGAQGT